MKRLLLVALVIAAFNSDISPAAKRFHEDYSDSVIYVSDSEPDCSRDEEIARQLAKQESAKKKFPRLSHGKRLKRTRCEKPKEVGPVPSVDLKKKMDSEIEVIKRDKLRLVQHRLVALQKKRWEKYQAKKAAEAAAKKGLTAFTYTSSLAGRLFSALSSGFGLFRAKPAVGGPFVGLVNNGNLCYQNAMFQAVHKCAPLREALQGNFRTQIEAGFEMPDYVKQFFVTLADLSGAVTQYNPVAFCAGLQAGIVDAAGRAIFPIGVQTDASEFIQIFWDRLQGAAIVPLFPAVDDGFHGVASHDQLVCSVCGAERFAAQECSTTLSLAIPPGDGAFSLNDLIANHCAEEVLAGDNAVECGGACPARTTHRKVPCFVINPAQQFMMVQVKRFEYLMTGQRVKRSNLITMPADGIVVINDSAGVEHRFKVVSAVVHAGAANGGHYWAVTPDAVYDDARVTPDGGSAMNQLLTTGLHGRYGTGYFYFLERV